MLTIYETRHNKIVIGDALTALRDVPSDTVDLIFADPPYNIGKDFDGIHDRIEEKSFIEWCYDC